MTSAAIALEKPLLIAYLGPEASNTHAAALKTVPFDVACLANNHVLDFGEEGLAAFEKELGIKPLKEFGITVRPRIPGWALENAILERQTDYE